MVVALARFLSFHAEKDRSRGNYEHYQSNYDTDNDNRIAAVVVVVVVRQWISDRGISVGVVNWVRNGSVDARCTKFVLVKVAAESFSDPIFIDRYITLSPRGSTTTVAGDT